MKCIHLQSLPSALLSQHKLKQYHVWSSINKPCTALQRNHRFRNGFSSSVSLVKTKALPSAAVFLAANLPTAGKLSVLLQTGGVCLVAYWIANFVVPEMILKDMKSKQMDEDGQNPDQR